MIKRLITNDEELIDALKRGERRAFEAVYKNYYRMAASFINSNSGDDQDIADVFQEMLFILVKKLKEKDFQLTTKLSTYIYSIIRNLWLQRLRKRKKSELALDEKTEDFIDLADEELELKRKHEKKHELMAQVLETLKEDCREVIISSFYKKLSHQAIAELMGYSASFVRVKLHRCMDNFRKKVKQHPDFQATLT